MLVFLLFLVLGSGGGQAPTFWLLLWGFSGPFGGSRLLLVSITSIHFGNGAGLVVSGKPSFARNPCDRVEAASGVNFLFHCVLP